MLIKTAWVILRGCQCQNTHFTYKVRQYTNFSWTYWYVKWVWDICLNTTNYPIYYMQDFRYWLFWSVLVSWYLHHRYTWSRWFAWVYPLRVRGVIDFIKQTKKMSQMAMCIPQYNLSTNFRLKTFHKCF